MLGRRGVFKEILVCKTLAEIYGLRLFPLIVNLKKNRFLTKNIQNYLKQLVKGQSKMIFWKQGAAYIQVGLQLK